MKHVDPASEEFTSLSRRQQAQIYLAMRWSRKAVCQEFDISPRTLESWCLSDELWQARLERQRERRRQKRTAARHIVTASIAETMQAMRDNGKLVWEIADATGFVRATVSQHTRASLRSSRGEKKNGRLPLSRHRAGGPDGPEPCGLGAHARSSLTQSTGEVS